MKATPKEGVERCPGFKKLVDQMVVVEFGYVTVFNKPASPIILGKVLNLYNLYVKYSPCFL